MKPILFVTAIRALILAVICLYSSKAWTQSWQCMQPGQKVYFTNGAGYLRGMRIDSTIISGNSVTWYPFRSPRGPYAHDSLINAASGSWLGLKVTALAGGRTYFFNEWNDTVVIETLAQPGNQWAFYTDGSGISYQANLVSADTMTISGTVDSVKRISIQTMQGTTPLPDVFSNCSILISKANGLVRAFDFFVFPFHKPNQPVQQQLDYLSDKSGATSGQGLTDSAHICFSRVSFQNATFQQIYGPANGDVYQYYDFMTGEIEEDSLVQMGSSFTVNRVRQTTYGPLHVTYDYNPHFFSFPFPSNSVVDTDKMPEEWLFRYLYWYAPHDTSYCLTGDLYRVEPHQIAWLGLVAKINTFEFCTDRRDFKVGVGRVRQDSICIDGDWTQLTLRYYKHAGVTCGTFKTLAVTTLHTAPALQIFPNPATGNLTIKGPASAFDVTIFNSTGQIIFSALKVHAPLSINTTHWPPGCYSLQCLADGLKTTHKIMVVH